MTYAMNPAAPPPVIQTQPTVVMQSAMSSEPGSAMCSSCQQQVVTVTRPINGFITWLICGILFFFIIWPCCLIPFCVKSCRDVEHTCPNCRKVIYVHKRI
ncbi:LITAF domain-containing protein [Clarias gariepinus]